MTDGDDGWKREVRYVPEDDVYTTTFDPGSDPPSVAVVESLAEVRRMDSAEMDPLYDAVDADALDALIERPVDSRVTVTFDVDGFEVTVSNRGDVSIRPPEGEI